MTATHVTHDAPKQETTFPPALTRINKNVLDDAVLKKLVDPEIYYSLARTRATGVPMEKAEANQLATSIREWAQSKGCIGYSHWFSPMRGPIHGEKFESFVNVDFSTNKLIVNLSGTELFQTETDGSSFPNGGLRDTHEAAAYMGWDTGSPPFAYRQTLYIPSAFVSWKGDALDQKTPLLRASMAVNEYSLRLLELLGDSDSKEVVCNVGWEQEFFLIDRNLYLERPDLIATGRTLLGELPLRGQEQSACYFSKPAPRINDFIAEARELMWELGVSIHCTHNEVAPAQFEISPVFTVANQAADTNILTMEVLKDLAYKHDFAILYHEKPFAGINGTGKHNNWGLNTDTGGNLFVPGDTEFENRRFVAFVAALMQAVNQHGDLLRCGVSTSGNDHRLGAQEAPPAIITMHVGRVLEQHLKDIGDGGDMTGYGESDKAVEVIAPVADIKANLEDRNRTSPFPWCGNRFEFRAVGGNQHIGLPLAMINAAMADSIRQMCDAVDGGKSVDQVIRETIKENAGALFSGNGYSEELYEHAKKYALTHLVSSPDAYRALTAEKNVALFKNLNIFTEQELNARQVVLQEAFATELQIEARALLEILSTSVIPAVMEDVRNSQGAGFESNLLASKSAGLQELLTATDELADAHEKMDQDDPAEAADYAENVIKPAMLAARTVSDRLESMVDRRLWKLPSYSEMLHRHQI